MISNQTYQLFLEIKPTVESYARKFYRTESPSELVSDFLGEAYLILRKFDAGVLQKKVEVGGELVPYDPLLHSNKQLHNTLKKYLVRSFTSHCKRRYKKKRSLLFLGDLSVEQFLPDHKPPQLTAEFVKAKELIQILDSIIEEKNRGYYNAKIEGQFLQAFVNHLNNLVEKHEDFIALISMSGMTRLSPETKIDIKKSFIKELSKIVLKNTDPLIVSSLGEWLTDRSQVELAYKKILKYFREEFDLRRFR